MLSPYCVQRPLSSYGSRGNSAGKWRRTIELSDSQLAEAVCKDRIDILVDLAGHMRGNRLRMFALKPAPIQVTAWGEPTIVSKWASMSVWEAQVWASMHGLVGQLHSLLDDYLERANTAARLAQLETGANPGASVGSVDDDRL